MLISVRFILVGIALLKKGLDGAGLAANVSDGAVSFLWAVGSSVSHVSHSNSESLAQVESTPSAKRGRSEEGSGGAVIGMVSGTDLCGVSYSFT